MHLRSLTLHPETYPSTEAYPFCLPVLREGGPIVFESPVTFFVGENGSGKSTLLEAVARRCGIHIWEGQQRVRVSKSPYEKRLHRHMSVEWTDGPVPGSLFASQIFNNYSRLVDEWAAATPKLLDWYGGKGLLSQSHGQSLMAFFRNRYKIKGLYLLDEPETALSPRSQLELLAILRDMGRAGHAQFLVATHSPILMACPDADILSFDEVPVRRVPYEQTEHYQVYHAFFSDPGRYVE